MSSYGYAGPFGGRGGRGDRGSRGERGDCDGRGRHIPIPPVWEIRIDENAKFSDFADFESVRVVTDKDQVIRVSNKIRSLANSKALPLPVNWPVTLTKTHLQLLESSPYVARLKPGGPRYLLLIDDDGNIYMENNARNVFEFDEDHAPQIVDFHGQPLKNTLLDGILTSMPNSPTDSPTKNNRVTFLIHDAIYCNGRSLKDLGVAERIKFVEDEVMKTRKHLIKSNVIDVGSEPFDLDIAAYEPATRAEKFLEGGFLNEQKYPFKSIIFHPRHEEYVPVKPENIFYWNFGADVNFDFLLKQGAISREGDLFVTDRGTMKKFGTITMTEELEKLHDCIITCFYADHQWIFRKRRFDRNHPNGLKAATDKLRYAEDPVTKEQLLASLEMSEGQE